MSARANDKLPIVNDSHLTEVTPIAQGSFGRVMKCRWKGKSCALKSLRPSLAAEMSRWANKKLMKEVALLKRLNGSHPDLFVQVYALYIPEIVFSGFLMEFCEHGSLRSLLSNIKQKASGQFRRLPWLTFSIMYDVCRAMKVLQESERAVYHKDLAIDNVLVTADFRGKLSDFGLSKSEASLVSSQTIDVESRVGVERRPPELMSDPLRKPDEFVDRYLFGICVCESFACESIRDRVGAGSDDFRKMATEGRLAERMVELLKVDCFDLCDGGGDEGFDKMRECVIDTVLHALALQPDSRPAFDVVADRWSRCLQQDCVDREQQLAQQKLASARTDDEDEDDGADSGVLTAGSGKLTGKFGSMRIGSVLGTVYHHDVVAEGPPSDSLMTQRFSDSEATDRQLQSVAETKAADVWYELLSLLGMRDEDLDRLEDMVTDADAAESDVLLQGLRMLRPTQKQLAEQLKNLSCGSGLRALKATRSSNN